MKAIQDLSAGLFPALALIALLTFPACSARQEKEQAPKPVEIQTDEGGRLNLSPEQEKRAGIQTARIRQSALPTVIRTTGRIDVPTSHQASVSIPYGGHVVSTRLVPGAAVRQGEVLAIVEDPAYIDLQEQYLSALARLQFLELDHKRQQELNLTKAGSDKALQQTEMDLRVQQVERRSLEQKLRLLNIDPASLSPDKISRSIRILSPLSGFVSAVHVHPGQYVQAQDALFEIIDPGQIQLSLKVFEKDLPLLSPGQMVEAYTNHRPDRKYAAHVRLIGRDLSDERTATVICDLDRRDSQIVPGLYMNADIHANLATAWVLPEGSLVRYEGKEFVFLQTETRQFEMREVKTGMRESDQVEIPDGQELAGKPVVTKGAYNLLMMLKNKAD